MNTQASETYSCNSRGCASGYGSRFEAAPSSWFAAKGMSPPKNCPTCRAWIKSQSDQTLRCVSCNRTMRIPGRYKISHHKRTGPWVPPEECRACERGERPPRSASERKRREHVVGPAHESGSKFSDLSSGIPLQPRNVAYKLEDYQHLVPIVGSRSREPRELHLAHHMLGSPHSQVGMVLPTRRNEQTATAFVGPGVEDVRMLVAAAGASLYTIDHDRMREYKEGSRLIRLTYFGEGHIEKTIVELVPGRQDVYRLVTTFDSVTVEQALKDHGRKRS